MLIIFFWFQWQERCKIATATSARASAELSRTNNIHSDTSHYDPGSSLALGNRQSTVLHVASVDDVQPLSVLTVGSSQRPLPMYDGASSVATAHGDQRCFSTSAAIEASSNGWGGVAGTGLHYMDPASRLAPTNFGIGVLGLNQWIILTLKIHVSEHKFR